MKEYYHAMRQILTNYTTTEQPKADFIKYIIQSLCGRIKQCNYNLIIYKLYSITYIYYITFQTIFFSPTYITHKLTMSTLNCCISSELFEYQLTGNE